MRLLHTADWHLGAADGNRSLYEDQLYFIREICRIIQEQKVDAVLISGDVYDRSVASAEAVSLYNEAMNRICDELNTRVLVIAGNHDSAERLATCSQLLKRAGLHIVGAMGKEPAMVSFSDADIYMLPWITEEKVKSVYPEEKDTIRDLTDAYRVALEHMERTFRKDKRHILMAHAFVAGAEPSESDRAAVIGYANQIPASLFDHFDYAALGHLHRPFSVNGIVRYSGTPMPYSFGKEETQEKSVTVIDTDTMEQTVIPVPLLHKRVTLEGTLAEIRTFPEENPELKDAYVRIHVTDSYAGPELFSELRELYPNILDIAGKSYDKEDSSVTMSLEEFEQMQQDPVEIFRYFCREELDTELDEHRRELFEKAVKATSEELE